MLEEETEGVKLRNYYFDFVVALVGFSAALAILRALAVIDVSFGLITMAPFIAAIHTVDRFLKAQNRLPSPAEAGRLLNGSVAISAAFHLLVALLADAAGVSHPLVQTDAVSSAKFWIMAIGLFVIILTLNYFVMRWVYGNLARRRAKRLGIAIAID